MKRNEMTYYPVGQVHNAELAETAAPAEQDSSARLNSALSTGVLAKVQNAELKNAEIFMH